MKRNVASQVIGAQLINKTDGSAVTSGTTTVYVTGDGGTQAAGSVGSGACTHEGHGYWTYNPAQAETNYDQIAFTFENSLSVNATVQVFTSFPQTGDGYARLGAPAGASHAADVAAVKAVLPAALVGGRMDSSIGAVASGAIAAAGFAANALDAVWSTSTRVLTAGTNIVLAKGTGLTGLNDLSAAQVNSEADTALSDVGLTTTITGRIDAAITTRLASGSYSAPPSAATIADAVWDETLSGHATGGSAGAALTGAGSAGDPWSASLPGAYGSGTAGKIIGDNIDAAISSRLASVGYTAPDNSSVTAIKAKTDNLPSDPADQSLVIAATDALSTAIGTRLAAADYTAPPTANQNADALLDRTAGVETGWTLRQAIRIMLSVLAGKSNGLATATAKYRDMADSKDRITATVDEDGNRSVVTRDAT
jgi:hypothetical protein